MIRVLVKRVLCGILVFVIVFVIWHVKLMNILDTKNCFFEKRLMMNILDTKNCSFEKRLIGKLLLKCEDEMLNTTETSLYDKKKPCEKK